MSANRILIVEDDGAIADFILLNLKYVGYEYMAFEDGHTESFAVIGMIPLPISFFIKQASS